MEHNKQNKQFGTRFGYLMVAAGASIGLGNIWKFPYLAYRGGGGVFLLAYLVVVLLMGKPMVEMETAIGRHGGSDTVTAFERINKKWGFVGWLANACTLMVNFFYVVVGGWCLKYAFRFIFAGNFGDAPSTFFAGFVAHPLEQFLWAFALLTFVLVMLLFGINQYVEKLSKVILPLLTLLLVVCGVYSCFAAEGAAEGLKYYLLPDFSRFSFKVFADAVTQALFSIGIGWGMFVTLGASVSKEQNIRGNSRFVCIADTIVAFLAGFTIIPSAFGAGIDVSKGPSLIFEVMTNIFCSLPFGRVFGAFFFSAVAFAVVSTLFSTFEISVKTFEEKVNLGRKKAILATGGIVMIGNALISLSYSVLSGVKLPWLSFDGIEYLGLYDWLDCCSGYLLLPLGCLLICIFVPTIWGWKEYEKELTMNGRDGKLTLLNKIPACVVIPILLIIVFLNVFGVIH